MDSRNPSVRYEAEIKSQMPYHYTTQPPHGSKISCSEKKICGLSKLHDVRKPAPILLIAHSERTIGVKKEPAAKTAGVTRPRSVTRR
jgi:hypothetical protein